MIVRHFFTPLVGLSYRSLVIDRFRKLCAVLSVIMIFSIVVGVAPVTAATLKITNNAYDESRDSVPQIHDGMVVWSGYDGTDDEIFLYNVATGVKTQITNNSSNDEYPDIKDGKIAWIGGSESSPDTFLYDISTGVTTQLTNSSSDGHFTSSPPKIADGKIVWGNYQGRGQLMLYDIATGITTQITNTSYDNVNPKIDNGLITWLGTPPEGYRIFLYDITTGITTQLTNTYGVDSLVDDGKVVWSGYDGTDNEVFFYDVTTGITTQITNNSYDDIGAQMSAGKVVWSGSNDIFHYDIATGITTQITNTTDYEGQARIDDIGNIVWRRYDGTDNEVFFYDVTTGTTTQLTDNTDNEKPAEIDEGLVVWAGYDGADYEIFLWGETLQNNSNTPAGSNVTYSENGVELTFSDVTTDGNTTITTNESGSQPPTGFRVGNPPTYLHIATTAVFTGTVEVCIDYSTINTNGNENNFKLMHYDEALGWINITSSLDTANDIICGNTTSFSDFVVMTAPTILDLIARVQEMNLHQGIENSLDSKLAAANEALSANNNGQQSSASSKLNAFINEVEAQRGNKLINSQADELHSFATTLIKLIEGTTQF